VRPARGIGTLAAAVRLSIELARAVAISTLPAA